eukprot:TRINITY_DN661_c0_g1_i1.p1 TRINITY_DN661_c0_g1~~TRINITY_DN661_c0_g1_i1.p1  ORF type:complete len:461 (+),score=104.13 TRINITY_DN661_c0_g1_i1:185-1567(+)
MKGVRQQGYHPQPKKTIVFQAKKRFPAPGPVQLPSMRAASGEAPRDSLADRAKRLVEPSADGGRTGAWRGSGAASPAADRLAPQSESQAGAPAAPAAAVERQWPTARSGPSSLPSSSCWASNFRSGGKPGAPAAAAPSRQARETGAASPPAAASSPPRAASPRAPSPRATSPPAACSGTQQWADEDAEMDFRQPLPHSSLLDSEQSPVAEDDGALKRQRLEETIRRRAEREMAEEKEKQARIEARLLSLKLADRFEPGRQEDEQPPARHEREQPRRRRQEPPPPQRHQPRMEEEPPASHDWDRQDRGERELHRAHRSEWMHIQALQRKAAIMEIEKQKKILHGPRTQGQAAPAPQRVTATTRPPSPPAQTHQRDREWDGHKGDRDRRDRGDRGDRGGDRGDRGDRGGDRRSPRGEKGSGRWGGKDRGERRWGEDGGKGGWRRGGGGGDGRGEGKGKRVRM